ncbi:autotransporter [Pantoea conspicua]|uniref:Autotransporter n=1 Tax=Pantoea conspicua TaxID=472705 RepID=A0A1X1BZK7_9GAMM|nr:autotransporter [Pantoea conspicua]
MVQKSGWRGQRYRIRVWCGAGLLFLTQPTFAWGGDFAAPAMTVAHPDYDTILAEKISRSSLDFSNENRALFEAALNSPASLPVELHSETGTVGTTPLGKRYRAGLELPVGDAVTTGPVAQYAVDPQQMGCLQCDYSDQQSREQVASVGWRVDLQQGWITPWAQLSYSRPLNESSQNDRRETAVGTRQESGIDLSVGAQLPLNRNLAAFASFSQNSALNSDEPLLYSLGISASF